MRIEEVESETPTVKALTFRDERCASAKPGQFVMVWVPGVDEVPMSVALTRGSLATIAVKKVGEATQALHSLKPGDKIGVRGPYGTHFSLTPPRGETLVAAGGTGIAPLMGAIERLAKSGGKAKVILGAESKAELLFLREIEKIASANPSLKFIPVTEDGSYGVKGDVAAVVASEAAGGFRGRILTCGPEPMIHKIFKFCAERRIPLQASLERVMRCGVGLCGSCDIAGFRVCRDGPVFNHRALSLMNGELGAYKRDFTGKLVKI